MGSARRHAWGHEPRRESPCEALKKLKDKKAEGRAINRRVEFAKL
jgi:hypothetical protein